MKLPKLQEGLAVFVRAGVTISTLIFQNHEAQRIKQTLFDVIKLVE